MNKTAKITFCGITAALGTVFMLLAYFPYFTYAVPAITGLLSLMILIEINSKWATATYLVTAFLALIFAETESKFLYLIFFGYYPIVKAHIEKIKSRAVQYLIKFALYNFVIILFYGLVAKFIGVALEDIGSFGKLSFLIFILLANVVFYLYDIVLVRAAAFYIRKIRPKLKINR